MEGSAQEKQGGKVACQKDTRQLERAPNSQNWNNLSNKVNNGSIGL